MMGEVVGLSKVAMNLDSALHTFTHKLARGGMLLALCLSGFVAAQAAGTVDASSVHARIEEARSNPALEKQLLGTGRRVAAVCANCHGDKGQSSSAETPVLAGQNPDYLVDQVRKYIDGRRRNMFMEGMLKALDRDETAGMVLFYAAQSTDPQPQQSPALVEKGRNYYAKVCVACHGVDGRGTASMPRLAGQHPGYVLASLNHFKQRDGVRSSPQMEMVVSQMTEADMRAVAAYVAALP